MSGIFVHERVDMRIVFFISLWQTRSGQEDKRRWERDWANHDRDILRRQKWKTISKSKAVRIVRLLRIWKRICEWWCNLNEPATLKVLQWFLVDWFKDVFSVHSDIHTGVFVSTTDRVSYLEGDAVFVYTDDNTVVLYELWFTVFDLHRGWMLHFPSTVRAKLRGHVFWRHSHDRMQSLLRRHTVASHAGMPLDSWIRASARIAE